MQFGDIHRITIEDAEKAEREGKHE
jgi:hypothetical protein